MKYFAQICFRILVSSLFMMPPVIANADDKPISSLTCASTVFAPYVIEENGKVKGIDVEVVEEIGKRLGIEITFKLVPWVRLEKAMEAGTETCVAAYFETEKRKQYMDFTRVPLHITSYRFFVNEDTSLQFTDIPDLYGMRISVNNGFKTTPAFEKAAELGLIEVQKVEKDIQGFKMLQTGRVDAVLTNSFVGAYNAKQLGLENITVLFPPLSSTPAYFTFSKKRELAHLVPMFDAALFEILQDGTYQQIFEKYTQ